MHKSILRYKSYPILKQLDSMLISLPAYSSLSALWNFGSLLGLCLMVQIITGVFLYSHYSSDVETAFSCVIHISRDVKMGWFMRATHANMASIFFLCLYIHIGRGLYYGSYVNKEVWNSGILLLLLIMAAAFLGYVLPWGQMSFWGATVITNLVSAVPYLGPFLVEWLWGGFSVGGPTLTRFSTFHFLVPMISMVFVIIHLVFLHEKGSSNPLGLHESLEKISFHSYYILKDLFGFVLLFQLLMFLVFFYPYVLGDPENFNPANPMVTPIHIQPEWYFLFAYAMLRSIPNKLGGVIVLVMGIFILFSCPFFEPKFKSLSFYPMCQVFFWWQVGVFLLLTWIGMSPVESPFILLGQILTVCYFLWFFLMPLFKKMWDKILSI